jgi:hypothetical protein
MQPKEDFQELKKKLHVPLQIPIQAYASVARSAEPTFRVTNLPSVEAPLPEFRLEIPRDNLEINDIPEEKIASGRMVLSQGFIIDGFIRVFCMERY